MRRFQEDGQPRLLGQKGPPDLVRPQLLHPRGGRPRHEGQVQHEAQSHTQWQRPHGEQSRNRSSRQERQSQSEARSHTERQIPREGRMREERQPTHQTERQGPCAEVKPERRKGILVITKVKFLTMPPPHPSKVDVVPQWVVPPPPPPPGWAKGSEDDEERPMHKASRSRSRRRSRSKSSSSDGGKQATN